MYLTHQTYVFNNIFWNSCNQFHLEETELCVNRIEFVNDRPDSLVFLVPDASVFNYTMDKRKTYIKNQLADDMLIREVFVVEVYMR
jgi:hypothetical protein